LFSSFTTIPSKDQLTVVCNFTYKFLNPRLVVKLDENHVSAIVDAVNCTETNRH